MGEAHLPEAYTCFSHALTISRSNARAWLSWGRFLDRLFMTVVRDHLGGNMSDALLKAAQAVLSSAQMAASLQPSGSRKRSSNTLLIASQAICAYLEVRSLCGWFPLTPVPCLTSPPLFYFVVCNVFRPSHTNAATHTWRLRECCGCCPLMMKAAPWP